MRKSLRILFIVLIIVLLISSFPIKYILGYPRISDLMRLIGFILLICYILLIKKNKA